MRSSSARRSSWSPSSSCPSKTTHQPSSSKTFEDEEDNITIANSDIDNSKGKVTGVDFRGNVPKVYYQDISGSPTASEMEPPTDKPAWLGMLKVNKPFEPNPTIL